MKNDSRHALRVVLIGGFSIVFETFAQTPEPPGNAELLALVSTESRVNAKKDEYETTDAYQKRLGNNVGRVFLLSVGLNPGTLSKSRAFSYNADTQTLTVTLVGDSSIPIMKMIDPLSAEAKKIGPGSMLVARYTKFTLVKSGPTTEREYEATTAMGVKATIKVMRSDFTAIALLNVPENAAAHPLAVQDIKLPPEAAKKLSTRAEWRLLVRTEMLPDQHSLVLDDSDYSKPTLSDPYELYVIGHTITASLLGAQLVDPDTSAVVATFASKGGPGAQAPPAASKDHAVLGVLLGPVTPAIAAALALSSPDGAIVSSVAADGTADKAGIKVGDILVKIGNTAIKTPMDVGTAISSVAVGSSIAISLIRQGSQRDLTVTF